MGGLALYKSLNEHVQLWQQQRDFLVDRNIKVFPPRHASIPDEFNARTGARTVTG